MGKDAATSATTVAMTTPHPKSVSAFVLFVSFRTGFALRRSAAASRAVIFSIAPRFFRFVSLFLFVCSCFSRCVYPLTRASFRASEQRV